jgi:hypothetical protein
MEPLHVTARGVSMKPTPIAGCEKALEQAKARLAFLEDFEARVLELNHERLCHLKNTRRAEIRKWEKALEKLLSEKTMKVMRSRINSRSRHTITRFTKPE